MTGQGGPRLVPAGNSFEDIFGGAGGVIPGGYRDALDSIANVEVGLWTNFFVLQSQRDLANAQDAELRAILDYQRALIEFDRTQRASLGAAGIVVVGGAMGGGAGAIY